MPLRISMKIVGPALVCLVLGLPLAWPSAASAGFMLDFGANGTLPSAQGLTYAGNVPENEAYNVSGGLLHLNTVQYSNDVYAYYHVLNGYTHTTDAELKAKVKVSNITNFYGVSFTFYDSTASGIIHVTPTRWDIDGISGAFSDQTAFHILDLKTSAATNTFTFFVDGTLAAAGTLGGGFGGPADVYFGDGTPTGGNSTADIAFVQYTNSDAIQAVPEPSSMVLASLAGITMASVGAWKKRRKSRLA